MRKSRTPQISISEILAKNEIELELRPTSTWLAKQPELRNWVNKGWGDPMCKRPRRRHDGGTRVAMDISVKWMVVSAQTGYLLRSEAISYRSAARRGVH